MDASSASSSALIVGHLEHLECVAEILELLE